MRALTVLALAAGSLDDGLGWMAGAPTIDDLHRAYFTIFPEQNRNAAAHRWAHFILERAAELDAATVADLFRGFCAVSGSPVDPIPQKTYRYSLEQVAGGWRESTIYHCCWPCVCDTQAFIKLDTKTIATADGPQEFVFQVLGDPCADPDALAAGFADPFSGRNVSLLEVAPAITCVDGALDRAVLSDHGYVIVGMAFDTEEAEASAPEPLAAHQPGLAGVYTPQDEPEYSYVDGRQWEGACADRQAQGYNSGMGAIFVKAAAITPVLVGALAEPLRIGYHAAQSSASATSGTAEQRSVGPAAPAGAAPDAGAPADGAPDTERQGALPATVSAAVALALGVL